MQRVLDTVCDPKDRPVVGVFHPALPKCVPVSMHARMDFDHIPSMMEMCIKYGEPFVEVVNNNRRMKLLHSQNGKGYWLGENRFRARWTAEIPVHISGNRRNPLYWIYFNPEMTDKVERRKALYEFLRKYDMAFSPVEKL